jgi:hypothetical protein
MVAVYLYTCGVQPIVADTSPLRKPPYGVDATMHQFGVSGTAVRGSGLGESRSMHNDGVPESDCSFLGPPLLGAIPDFRSRCDKIGESELKAQQS